MHRFYGRPSDGREGSPLRCDGYCGDARLRYPDGGTLPLAELPPFLRALLVTDGTVTKILEAYFWEPVTVDTLEQGFQPAEAPVPWLGVEPGDLCLVRDALLRGVHSGRVFAEASSLIRSDLIPADFRRRLIDREIGIGALIRDSGLESYREVLDAGLASGPDREGWVFRTYRILLGGQSAILITERFPLGLYRRTEAAPAP
jgi:chorismate-pyruvate lyase